jgi:hypothetical protein
VKVPESYEGLDLVLKYQALDPQWLNNDHVHYQRDLDIARSGAYTKKELKGRTALVAYHPDGTYWVIDGQHHTAAAVRLGIDLVGCWVYNSTGWKMDKEVFNAFQERSSEA